MEEEIRRPNSFGPNCRKWLPFSDEDRQVRLAEPPDLASNRAPADLRQQSRLQAILPVILRNCRYYFAIHYSTISHRQELCYSLGLAVLPSGLGDLRRKKGAIWKVERVINVQNQEIDTAAVDAFCAIITKEVDSIPLATKLLAFWIQSTIERQALQALTVYAETDCYVQYCGVLVIKTRYHGVVGTTPKMYRVNCQKLARKIAALKELVDKSMDRRPINSE
ncbi:hypothetical protein TSAR_014764 [Trichomalopsis sarcophagae]|uniref:Uncharacterized protein n=1 Tax=Trichomalopsis sarcophagae TaxID=543379 RepID=A0A232FL43_9HYME|nr:hypothetical protein TSAR_014764 [Trichomalopsis sarcophagae]